MQLGQAVVEPDVAAQDGEHDHAPGEVSMGNCCARSRGPVGRRPGWWRIRLACPPDQLPIAADADFCITGTVDPASSCPKGPFGDHLGYYSLAHPSRC